MNDLYLKQKRAREPGTGSAVKQKPGKIQTDQCQSWQRVVRSTMIIFFYRSKIAKWVTYWSY